MSGKRLALLIANANYEHPELRKLSAPLNDVQTLQALLERADIGGYETKVLVDATKTGMEKSIDRVLADRGREDTILIFFAGHGLKHENGKLFFAARDTEPEYLGGTGVSASWLVEEMQASRAGCQMILLDCCFGGAFARGSVLRGGDKIESGRMLEIQGLGPTGRGQVVITSVDAMQFAFEGGSFKGTVSTSFFVQALIDYSLSNAWNRTSLLFSLQFRILGLAEPP